MNGTLTRTQHERQNDQFSIGTATIA